MSPPAAVGLTLFVALGLFVGWLWWQGEPPLPQVVTRETDLAAKPPAPPDRPSPPAEVNSAPAETSPAAGAAPHLAPPAPAAEPSSPEKPTPESRPPAAAAPAEPPPLAQPPAQPPAPPSPAPSASAPPPAAVTAPPAPPPPASTPAAPAPPPPKIATAPQPPPPAALAPTPKPSSPAPGKAAKPDASKTDTPKTGAPKPEHVGPLPPVPDPALVQQSPHGPLPIIGADGRKPWQVYARPFDGADKRPRIAVVVADMGLSQAATQSAITRLPSAVTLAFAPYSSDLQSWIAQARAAGHEALLQLPMEPLDYPHNDPGPRALLTSLKPSDNLDRLSWLLGRFTGYVGVTNYMGSKFTASTNDVRPILDVLAKRGLLFVDSRSSARSVATRIAADLGMPRAYNDRFLDNEASRNAIDARLEELERIALKSGAAVGIGYPYPVTIDRIAHWAPTLAAKGIALVPVTAVVDKQSE